MAVKPQPGIPRQKAHKAGAGQSIRRNSQWVSTVIALLITALIISGIAFTLDSLFRTVLATQ